MGAPEVDLPAPGACVDGGDVPCVATSFALERSAGLSGVGLELGARLGVELVTDVGGDVHTGLRQGLSSGFSSTMNLRVPQGQLKLVAEHARCCT